MIVTLRYTALHFKCTMGCCPNHCSKSYDLTNQSDSSHKMTMATVFMYNNIECSLMNYYCFKSYDLTNHIQASKLPWQHLTCTCTIGCSLMNYHCYFKSYELTNQSDSNLKVVMTTLYICTCRTGCSTNGVSNVY